MSQVELAVDVWHISIEGLKHLDLPPGLPTFDEVSRYLPKGAYTTFRTYGQCKRVLGLAGHLERLEYSAAQLGWRRSFHRDQLRTILADLLDGLSCDEARVRITLDTSQSPGSLYISLQPLQPLPAQVYEKGVKTRTCHLQRRQPEVKSTDFLRASRPILATMPPEVFELLLVGPGGEILEGMTSNFFGFAGGQLRTAGQGVLEGITRQVVLNLASELEMPILLEPVRLDELASLSEAFLTSSSRGLIPIVMVDNQAINAGQPGPQTFKLMRLYQTYLERHAETILPSTA